MKQNAVYLAGFFDGEGYVGITRRQRGKYLEQTIRLSIGQKDGATMDWIKDNFGGNVYLVKRDGSYEWVATNRVAYQILMKITPYLKYKKPQAELAIQFYTDQGNKEDIVIAMKQSKHVFTPSLRIKEQVQRLNELTP